MTGDFLIFEHEKVVSECKKVHSGCEPAPLYTHLPPSHFNHLGIVKAQIQKETNLFQSLIPVA